MKNFEELLRTSIREKVEKDFDQLYHYEDPVAEQEAVDSEINYRMERIAKKLVNDIYVFLD